MMKKFLSGIGISLLGLGVALGQGTGQFSGGGTQASQSNTFVPQQNFAGNVVNAPTPQPTNGSTSITGTPGSNTESYAVYALCGSVYSAPMFTEAITSPATLNVSNYVVASWNAVTCPAGQTPTYKAYRFLGGSIGGATLGLVYSGTAVTFNDTGLTGDGTTPPSPTPTTGLETADTFSGRVFRTTSVGGQKLGPFRALATRMEGGISSGLQIVGDSTGVDSYRWPWILARYFSWKYPTFAVREWLWDDANQYYDQPLYYGTSTGTDTNERHVVCAGTGSTAVDGTLLSAANWQTPGVVELRAKIDLASWRPGVNSGIAASWSTVKIFRWYISTAGNMVFLWSADGSATVATDTSTTAIPSNQTNPLWVRVKLTLATGALQYYTAPENPGGTLTWTQLGTTITTGATSIYTGAAATAWEICSVGTTSFPMTGNIYALQMWGAASGATTYPFNPQNMDWWMWQSANVNNSMAGSPTLDIVNGSKSGAALSYFTNATRQPQILLDYGQSAFIFNDGHNETTSTGYSAWLTPIQTYFTAVQTALPKVQIIVKDQNPRLPTISFAGYQRERMYELTAWAPSHGYGLIDSFQLFDQDSRGLAALLLVDGVHPNNQAGAQLDAQSVIDAYENSR